MLTAKERLAQVTKRRNDFAYWVGFDIHTEGFRVFNLRLVGTLSTALMFYICTFNAIMYYGNMEQILFCVVSLVISYKGVTQGVFLVKGRHIAEGIMEIYYDIYARASELQVEPTLHKYCNRLEKLFKFLHTLLAIAAIAADLNPVLVKFLTGDLILPFGMVAPYTDPVSTVGYIINYLLSFHITIYGYLFYNCLDGALLGLIYPAFSIFDMLCDLIDQLENDKNENSDKTVDEIRHEKLRTIFQIHQDLMGAISEIEDLFSMCNGLSIIWIQIAVVTSIFALIAIGWYIGIVFIGLFLFELFIICIFGTGLEIMQDKLKDKINNIIWYDKSKSEKSSLLIVHTAMNNMQTFTCVTATLNMEYFLNVSDLCILWIK